MIKSCMMKEESCCVWWMIKMDITNTNKVSTWKSNISDIPDSNVFKKQKQRWNHQDHIQQSNQFKIEMHKMDVQILK